LDTGYSKIFRAGRSISADNNLFTWQVAAATSAAPTYFPAFRIPNVGLFVDGGVWANNPAIVGLTEAMTLTKSSRDIHLLSIGTGEKSFRTDRPRHGLISWKLDLIDLVFRSQNDGVYQQCNKLKNHITGTFRRICPPALQAAEAGLDDIQAASRLRNLATEIFDREWADVEREFFS
jgi:patatin-like phospholipase/acyl hydrolase